MAHLPTAQADYLRKIARSLDLRLRNWSHDDKIMFAVYRTDDDYLGVVEIDRGYFAMKIAPNQVGLRERDRKPMSNLVMTWNAARGQ